MSDAAACPRCGLAFRCRVNDPTTPCDCTRVTLSVPSLAAMRAAHESCLCLACLRDIAAGAPVQRRRPAR